MKYKNISTYSDWFENDTEREEVFLNIFIEEVRRISTFGFPRSF